MTNKGVISGYAGIGKSYLAKNYTNVIDLESGIFQYGVSPEDDHEAQKGDSFRKMNPNWLEEYIEAIKKAKEEYDYVLIAQFPELLDELIKQEINFTMVAPEQKLKDEYKKRYRNRGNRESWVKSMTDRWDIFLTHNYKYARENNIQLLILKENQYLEDILSNLRK